MAMFLKAKDIFDAFGSAVHFNNHVSGNVFLKTNTKIITFVPLVQRSTSTFMAEKMHLY